MKLDEIRKLCDETTPGPWGSDRLVLGCEDFAATGPLHVDKASALADCRFIAAARDLMPKLLAVAEAADDRIAGAIDMGVNPDYFQPFFDALAALEAS